MLVIEGGRAAGQLVLPPNKRQPIRAGRDCPVCESYTPATAAAPRAERSSGVGSIAETQRRGNRARAASCRRNNRDDGTNRPAGRGACFARRAVHIEKMESRRHVSGGRIAVSPAGRRVAKGRSGPGRRKRSARGRVPRVLAAFLREKRAIDPLGRFLYNLPTLGTASANGFA